MWIKIRRITEMKCPHTIVAEGAVDWTHFNYIHRRSHKVFKLLFKTETRSIIYYQARALYPLPIYNYYLIVREEIPDQYGYHQVYYDLKKHRTHYLKAVTVDHGETSSIIGDFYFDVAGFWKLLPKTFFNLFKWRMRSVMREDNVYMRERILLGTKTTVSCEVQVPKIFDLLSDFLANPPQEFSYSFADHVKTDLLTWTES